MRKQVVPIAVSKSNINLDTTTKSTTITAVKVNTLNNTVLEEDITPSVTPIILDKTTSNDIEVEITNKLNTVLAAVPNLNLNITTTTTDIPVTTVSNESIAEQLLQNVCDHDELVNKLSEILILFNTSPKVYEKSSFIKLILFIIDILGYILGRVSDSITDTDSKIASIKALKAAISKCQEYDSALNQELISHISDVANTINNTLNQKYSDLVSIIEEKVTRHFETYNEVQEYWITTGKFLVPDIISIDNDNYEFFYLPATGVALDIDLSQYLKKLGAGSSSTTADETLPVFYIDSDGALILEQQRFDEYRFGVDEITGQLYVEV